MLNTTKRKQTHTKTNKTSSLLLEGKDKPNIVLYRHKDMIGQIRQVGTIK